MLRDLPEWGYVPAGDIDTPSGPRNTGYVHSTAGPAAQWTRGVLPIGGETGFGLGVPKVMREPGTTMGLLELADRRVVVDLSQG